MVLTNDEQLYQALLRLRSHGITRDPRFYRVSPMAPGAISSWTLGITIE